jgi:pancreatic elastase II
MNEQHDPHSRVELHSVSAHPKRGGRDASRRGLCALTAMALFTTACGDVPTDFEDEDLGTLESGIKGGTNVTSTGFPFDAVFRVQFGAFDGITCTATKIGPRKFLTAAHCGLDMRANVENGEISLTNANAPTSAQRFNIQNLFVHPSWDSVNDPNPRRDIPDAYDVAVFIVTQDTPGNPVFFCAPHIDPGRSARFIGFGRDVDRTPDLPAGERKQTATSTTATQGSASATSFTHNIITRGGVAGDRGDSGGPLFIDLAAGSPLSGVLSKGDISIDETKFARTANTCLWIDNPHEMTATSVYANNSRGFLQNAARRKCARSTGLSGQAGLGHCDGRNQTSTSGDEQYWRLLSVSGTSFFRVQNTKTGLCMTTFSFGFDPVGEATCSTTDEKQQWSFTASGVSGLRAVRNRSFNRCLEGLSNDSLVNRTCNNLSPQLWHFYR